MGRGMAHRLKDNGVDLIVHDVVTAAGDDFVKAGVPFGDTVSATCAGRDARSGPRACRRAKESPR